MTKPFICKMSIRQSLVESNFRTFGNKETILLFWSYGVYSTP